MEDQDKARTCENQLEEEQLDEEENVVTFLDSMDAYLTLIDSLSSTLRQVEVWSQLDPTFFSISYRLINPRFDVESLLIWFRSFEFENLVQFRILCWCFYLFFIFHKDWMVKGDSSCLCWQVRIVQNLFGLIILIFMVGFNLNEF